MKNMADNIGKLNKNKHFVGNKKLKNVKMYEEFEGAQVNENKRSFAQDLESNFYNLNILNALIDEGYCSEDGRLKEGVSLSDINDYLEKEHGARDFFDAGELSEGEALEAWVLDTLDELHKFASKYKDEYVR